MTARVRRTRVEDELKGVEDVVGDVRHAAPAAEEEAVEKQRAFVLQEEKRRLARLKQQNKQQEQQQLQQQLQQLQQQQQQRPVLAVSTAQPVANPQESVGASRVWKTKDLLDSAQSSSTDADAETAPATAIMETSSNVLARRSGWLLKQGMTGLFRNKKIWKRRYFSLEDKYLTYRADEYDYELSGILHVKHIISVGSLELPEEKGFPIFIALPKRTMIMIAESEKDAKGWIQSLRKARALCTETFGEDQVTELIF